MLKLPISFNAKSTFTLKDQYSKGGLYFELVSQELYFDDKNETNKIRFVDLIKQIDDSIIVTLEEEE